MNKSNSQREVLIALTGRNPGDAIVQATLVQQLKVLEVSPSDVVVAHASANEPQPTGWFADVRYCHRGNFLMRQLALLRVVTQLLRSSSIGAIYARDVVVMQVALASRLLAREQVAIIFDCRGDIAAEAQLRGTSRLKVAILSRLQKRSWRRANRVMVVSNALASLVTKAAPNAQVVVVPNLQSEALPVVEEIRPRPLVAFAGGAQAWQDSSRVMKDLARLQQAGIDIEVITRDEGLAQRASALGFTVSSGDRAHVLHRLQRATASWMVRADAAANTVASPVKLGEALSAGAVVIGSLATWEYMAQLAADELAIVVPRDGKHERYISGIFDVWAQGAKGRSRRLEVVQRNWTLQAYHGELRTFFGTGIVFNDG